MLTEDTIEAFNNRLTVDLNNIKKMSPAQQDKVKSVGSQAEALLANKNLAQFVHTFKFERLDALADIDGHTPEDDKRRIAIAHQIAGVDELIKSLRRAVYFKDKIVTLQQPVEPKL